MTNILVMGGAGFVGSHLTRKLLKHTDDIKITVVDRQTETEDNLLHEELADDKLTYVCSDVKEYIEDVLFNQTAEDEFDVVYYALNDDLDYKNTMELSTTVLHDVLMYANEKKAKVVYVSSSDVYGPRPKVYPVTESYAGNVNPTAGLTALFLECKRIAEATCTHCATYGVDVNIARVFPAYGVGCSRPNFVMSVTELLNEDSGDMEYDVNPEDTMSFIAVEDVADALVKFMDVKFKTHAPVNIGSDSEHSAEEILTMMVSQCSSSKSRVSLLENAVQKPTITPDISVAKHLLEWKPETTLFSGLGRILKE